MLQTAGARASCDWLGLRTIDELINRFSLGLIQRLNQIKGSGHWAAGNKGSHQTRKLGRKMGRKSGPSYAWLSQATSASSWGKEWDSPWSES